MAGWSRGWLGVVGLAIAAGAARTEEVRNVVVIGWDGAQRDHLKEMIARDEIPNFVALAKEGAMIEIDVTTGATDTKAGWTQIWTGYDPERSGVYSNGRYQPIPPGYSVFERVEAHFGPGNVDTVAVIGKKGHVDNDPPKRVPYAQWEKREQKQKKIDQAKPGRGNLQGGKIVEANGEKYVETPGKPWYLASQKMDLFENGLVLTERVGTRALEELEKRKDRRFVLFVHFAEPDHSGHKHGENSQEYTDAIKEDDLWTGKIVARLKELGLYEKTLVYVVQDHGFNEGQSGHGYAPYVLYATNDRQVTRKEGTRADLAPTVLKRLGIDLAAIDPPLDGIPLDVEAPERKAPAEKSAALGGRKKKAGDAAGADPAAERKAKRKAARQGAETPAPDGTVPGSQ